MVNPALHFTNFVFFGAFVFWLFANEARWQMSFFFNIKHFSIQVMVAVMVPFVRAVMVFRIHQYRSKLPRLGSLTFCYRASEAHRIFGLQRGPLF